MQRTALRPAIADTAGLDKLYLCEFVAGGSCQNCGEAVDFREQPLAAFFTQDSLTAGIDPLIALEWLPVPHHIKITVDGTEPKIPVGARQTIERPRPKSMLAETYGNLDAHPAIVNTRLDTSFE